MPETNSVVCAKKHTRCSYIACIAAYSVRTVYLLAVYRVSKNTGIKQPKMETLRKKNLIIFKIVRIYETGFCKYCKVFKHMKTGQNVISSGDLSSVGIKFFYRIVTPYEF